MSNIERHESGQVTLRVLDHNPEAFGMRKGGIRNDQEAWDACQAVLLRHFPAKAGSSFTETGIFVHLMPPVIETDTALEQRRAACGAALSKLVK